MDKKFNIIGFCDFDDKTYPTISLRGDELSSLSVELCDYLKKHNIYYSGNDHQNHNGCTPVFDNGFAFRASMRLWGAIMAKAYGNNTSYMNFYMESSVTNYPTNTNIEIKPGKAENEEFPYLAREDIELIKETVDNGIDELMTFDKALIEAFPILKEYFIKQKQEEEKMLNQEVIFLNGRDINFVDSEDNSVTGKALAIVKYEDKSYILSIVPGENKRAYVIEIYDDGKLKALDKDKDTELIRKIVAKASEAHNE